MARPQESRQDPLLAQQSVLAEFGEFALRADNLDDILNAACQLVGRTLRTELAKIIERQADGQTLFVRAGVGWRPDVVGQLTLSIEEDTATAYALEADEPVISTDLVKEERFKIADFLVDHGVKALVNVPIPGPTGQPPYGILEVDSREPRRFTEHDTDFLRTYANLLTAAIERIHSLHALRTTVADKERLLRELQHRVRNNLQMIIGLVRLQERQVQSWEARNELLSIARRIETLSLVYDKLYTSGEVERVDLGTYLGELGATLLQFHADKAPGVRLRTDVERLVLPLEQALPLGLIVNEFMTNSFKYAFTGRSGLIGLEIRKDAADKAHLRLWDDGTGMPKDDPPSKQRTPLLSSVRGRKVSDDEDATDVHGRVQA